MPKKHHRIYVNVWGAQSQRFAMSAVLYAFAQRKPDGCGFTATTEAQENYNHRRRSARRRALPEKVVAACNASK